jgi:hypothetical protein
MVYVKVDWICLESLIPDNLCRPTIVLASFSHERLRAGLVRRNSVRFFVE